MERESVKRGKRLEDGALYAHALDGSTLGGLHNVQVTLQSPKLLLPGRCGPRARADARLDAFAVYAPGDVFALAKAGGIHFT